jgi:Uma2 family endonuclease
MTFEEFLTWVPDGVQAEWVDGEVIVLTVSDRHARLSRLFVNLLSPFLAMFNLGEVFHAPFLMRAVPGGPGREPDILVLLASHQDRVHRLGVAGPADFVVEFLSQETARTDRVRKFREYAAAGVSEYVIVDARHGRTGFDFFRLNDQGRYEPVAPDLAGRYHSSVLPGLWLDSRWFEQDPLPDAEDLLVQIAPDAYAAWILAKLNRDPGRGAR